MQDILLSNFLMSMVTHPLGSYLAQSRNPKVVLGCLGMLGPILLYLSSYARTFELWWVCYVFAYGFVDGITYMSTVKHGWDWWPTHTGLASGIIISGHGLSGFIWNYVSLELVNPEHESADEKGIYSDEVSKNVPQMLRTLAICYACLILIAVALVFKRQNADNMYSSPREHIEQEQLSLSQCFRHKQLKIVYLMSVCSISKYRFFHLFSVRPGHLGCLQEFCLFSPRFEQRRIPDPDFFGQLPFQLPALHLVLGTGLLPLPKSIRHPACYSDCARDFI